ncbi:ribosomal RNA processing protein 36 homolog [Orussus abietinus]|uniref:ribosomal RNA processing protein 36 homolog n=1 Tax=Orussus abietinus TaxID=222816 RepID=UPI0006258A04|nr:ribosomal RNA processing protein 36 homolog [Orussus abietinus]
MNDEDDRLLDVDKDQTEIRAELSHMSFEDLKRLKEKLGSKVYNEAIFGPQRVKKVDFKRENKNRPREMSAKKPVSRFKEVVSTKKIVPRDPRFDSLCGTFNETAFKRSYGFISKLRENDLEALHQELQSAEDPKVIKKIKYLIQRLKNQLTEEKRHNEDKEKKYQEKQEIIQAIKHGERPTYKKKSEKKVLDLISQYEQLKNSGKLKKHIQRLRKKNISRDRRKLSVQDTE